MKKDRNHFFESSNYQMSSFGQNVMPNMPMPFMNNQNNNIYPSGGLQNSQQPMDSSSIDSFNTRISKIERDIQRLDARINKLESTSINNNFDSDNNMYMV